MEKNIHCGKIVFWSGYTVDKHALSKEVISMNFRVSLDV